MNFLEALAIPRSEEMLKLLEIFYFLSTVIFNLYLVILFGSILYSLVFYLIAIKRKDNNYLSLSYEFLNSVANGYLSFIGLGFVPLLSVYYALLQFILKAPSAFFQALLLSITCFVLSVILIKLSYKRFSSTKNLDNLNLVFVSSNLFVLILILAIFIFTNATAFSIVTSQFASSNLSFENIFSIGFILRFLAYLFMSIIASSLFYFYKIYSTDRISIESNVLPDNSSIKNLLKNFIIAGNIFPFIIVAIFISLPKNLVTMENYIFVVISLLVILLSLLFGYLAMKSRRVSYAKASFFISLLSFMFFFASDANLLAVSNKIQEFKIAKEFKIYHENLLASAGRSVLQEVNGEEIYKAKCVACHQFDTKLVGPPHKEVLKKYENRKEDMVKFIINPVKVDPNYPPMPNQGLKPNEAEAVVKYMFEHYGPMLK